ncbi:MAG: topoisomerase DNA-binding C4 zinc finger domain-containing protein, partial [Candidatus Riflebacteria bacterium]|nr:topoisomerase DNA-binding C4 zinc finger domain-containing protein [Candidatus Riflebacteria bacterium]
EDYKNEGSPNCPKCGNPMRKVVARKGHYAGKSFWGCTSYPECNGTREL